MRRYMYVEFKIRQRLAVNIRHALTRKKLGIIHDSHEREFYMCGISMVYYTD